MQVNDTNEEVAAAVPQQATEHDFDLPPGFHWEYIEQARSRNVDGTYSGWRDLSVRRYLDNDTDALAYYEAQRHLNERLSITQNRIVRRAVSDVTVAVVKEPHEPLGIWGT